MNICYLRSLLNPWEDCRILNRSASIDGAAVSAAALTLREGVLSLWLVQHDPTFASRLEEAELRDLEEPLVEPATRRDQLFSTREVEPLLPVEALRSVTADGREYVVDGTSMGRIENDWQQVLTLTVLLQAGWEPGVLEDIDTDCLFLTQVDFQEPFDTIPSWDGPLELRMHPRNLSQLVEVNVTLGAEPVKLTLPHGDVLLLGWETADIWAELEKTFSNPKILERFTPEELAQQRRHSETIYEEFCPRGMVFPALRYEAPEDTSIQCYLTKWLDAPIPRGSSSTGMLGVSARPEGADVGPRNLPVRLDVISDLPLLPDSLEGLSIGAIRWSQRIPVPPLTL